MSKVKCRHTFKGKKKFLCNDPDTGEKMHIPCQFGFYVSVDERIAAQYPEVFTPVSGAIPEPADEKDDAPDDADEKDSADSGADDGAEIDPPADEDPADSADSDDSADSESEDGPVDNEVLEQIAGIKKKDVLEEYGRGHGVELDRRRSLKNMKKDLIEALELEPQE